MELDEFWYRGGNADDVHKELKFEESRYELCQTSLTESVGQFQFLDIFSKFPEMSSFLVCGLVLDSSTVPFGRLDDL